MVEIKVNIKDEDLRVSETFLEYTPDIVISTEDETLKARVAETISKVKKTLVDPEIVLKMTYVWDRVINDK